MRGNNISASTLKTVALITMLVDHFADFLLTYYMQMHQLTGSEFYSNLYEIGRFIGRISFFLFAFMIGEGVRHTHDFKKYCLRLLALAIISEYPFYLAGSFDPMHNGHNVFWTLLLGAICCKLIEMISAKSETGDVKLSVKSKGNTLLSANTFAAVIVVLIAIVAKLCKTDYGFFGIILIVLLYTANNDRTSLFRNSLIAIIVGKAINVVLAILIKTGSLLYFLQGAGFVTVGKDILGELPAIAGLFLIWNYNGQKGRQLHKAFYYFFYPAHLLIIGLIISFSMQTNVNVKVSMQDASSFNDGKFEGFGTSFCWWANRIGYDDKLSKEAASAFYSEDGLNMNIIRYNIGGGDDPSHNHITRTDSEVPGYAINPKVDELSGQISWDYDWSKDSDQRNVLLEVQKLGKDDLIVEAFSNSAPYFMTISGCSSGAKKAKDNNLLDYAYDDFARYIADVVAYYKDNYGIEFESVSAMNEPDTNYWQADSPKQEGCHFDPGKTQSKMILELDKALDDNGLGNVKVTASDETSINKQISSYKKLSDEAKNAVDRIDTHSYQGNKRKALRGLALSEGKNLWMSEVDDGGIAGDDAGQMGAGLHLANMIIEDLNGLRPSAWVLWQIIDNHICKEGRNGNEDYGMVDVNDGYWGAVVADHDNDKLIYTMKYYAYGQFTRYIRPGDTIIATGNDSVVSYNSDTGRVTIVVVNNSKKDKNYSFDLSNIGVLTGKAAVIRTSGSMEDGEKWKELEPIAVDASILRAVVKGNSITTYVIE